MGVSREMTIVRIPLRSAKHHFGAQCVRGTRPYNEDAYQAGTIEVPAFAKRAPVSLNIRRAGHSREQDKNGEAEEGSGTAAESASGDPQVFYFGVFDGHGGDKCSHFLRDGLHTYVERSAGELGMASTLQGGHQRAWRRDKPNPDTQDQDPPSASDSPNSASSADRSAESLLAKLVQAWRDTVGGYFRRFKPDYLSEAAGGKGMHLSPSTLRSARGETKLEGESSTSIDSLQPDAVPIEQVVTHSFLSSDLDFVNDQLPEDSGNVAQRFEGSPAEDAANDIALGRHVHHSSSPFLGGSTCSLALISTPTPTPFWHPSTPLTLATGHVGDTRVLLCATETGIAVPLTSEHHPAAPGEAARLRRYAGAFTTDSFGEERFAAGLANTRAFGDIRSKRMGVSAEPEMKLIHLKAGEGSFLVLCSDGVNGILSDQEIVDVVKEARTPEEGAKNVVSLSEELAVGEKGDSDNATCIVVRLGGWERRSEGGGGSLRTKEAREWRRSEASDPRRGRR